MAGESVVSSRVVPKSGLEIPDGCTLRAWKISLYDRNLGQQYRTTLPEREYHSYKCARQSAAPLAAAHLGIPTHTISFGYARISPAK